MTAHQPTLGEAPVLPYAGTSGHAGSTASLDRALDADRSGRTAGRQSEVLSLLHLRGADGLTWRELSDATGWHHGTASGALSVLHKAGHIARLTERRLRCSVYVIPSQVRGRLTEQPGRTTAAVERRRHHDRLTLAERAALTTARRSQALGHPVSSVTLSTLIGAVERLSQETP